MLKYDREGLAQDGTKGKSCLLNFTDELHFFLIHTRIRDMDIYLAVCIQKINK